MKILLVGGGGREHALAWKISSSSLCDALYCCPGNAGIAEYATLLDIAAEDVENIVKFVLEEKIDFVVVGPEAPLVAGLADELKQHKIPVFGPSQKAARLEGSKSFTKDLCAKYNIPTAAYARFTDADKAAEYLETSKIPVVVKADGLAAGKGVIIAESKEEAVAAAKDMLSGNSFGSAGSEIVIEEFLVGEEVSYFALCDGENFLTLSSAQDHKRAYDDDQGPNTGGMGAYSPAREALFTKELEQKVIDRIIAPTVEAMKNEACPFLGVLYAGLMICNGEPFLIEYNARFGDPECQPLMMRWDCDIVEILYAIANGKLSEITSQSTWNDKTAMCVVMASEGYPGKYTKNTVIKGIEDADNVEGVKVFHAGTAKNSKGEFVNVGGRVLGVTSIGKDFTEARQRAYDAVDRIDWEEGFCRRDIGWRAL